jgi:serine/threonine protein phosphatase PrpC
MRTRTHALAFGHTATRDTVTRARMPEHAASASARLHHQPELEVGSATDVGRVREMNEDALLVLEPAAASPTQPGASSTADSGSLTVLAVADGMGGHKAGEVASAMAVESLRAAFSRTASGPGTPENPDLRDVIEMANRAIWDAAGRDLEKDGMGTTLVCGVMNADGAGVVANVGDSRAYLVADTESATLVTSDHTWVNEQVLSGQMTERQARTSPYRNLLTRSLGSAPHVDVDIFAPVRLEPGHALVLVSDGVTGYLDERDIAAILRAASNAQAAAERLVAEAVARGGADNATAVVAIRRA